MILRTDPFREMDRWLDTVLRQVPTAHPMPMDLYRDGESFVARVDLPGVNPATIDIDVEDRTLTIRAERAAEESESLQWLSRERPTGTFARQLTLGHGVELDNIDAGYADGVLTLTLPMAEEARPRKIEVAHTPALDRGAARTIESGSTA